MGKIFVKNLPLILLFTVLTVIPVTFFIFLTQKNGSKNETEAFVNDLAVHNTKNNARLISTIIPGGMSDVTVLKPTITPMPTGITASSSWVIYQSGSSIGDDNFSFTYPNDWNVILEKTPSRNRLVTSLQFVFYPVGFLSKGQNIFSSSTIQAVNDQMGVDIYPQAEDAQSFINKNYPQYNNTVTYSVYGIIGNKTMYLISPKADVPLNDPIYTNFGEHGIVLGTHHVYDIGFAKGSSSDVISQVISTIWPQFYFE